jgi:hypothetical protein
MTWLQGGKAGMFSVVPREEQRLMLDSQLSPASLSPPRTNSEYALHGAVQHVAEYFPAVSDWQGCCVCRPCLQTNN